MDKTSKEGIPSILLGLIADTGSCSAMGEVLAEFSPYQVHIEGKSVTTQRALDVNYTITRSRDVDRFFGSLETGPNAKLAVSTKDGVFLLAGLTFSNHERGNGRRVTVLTADIVTQVK